MKRLLQPLRWALPALLLAGLGANAQTLTYTNANVAGTYTDLGTAGTALTMANTDDANSAAQTLPFSFAYNGATFTQFVVNTNGFLKLGAVAPPADTFVAEDSTSTATDPLVSAEANLILAFNTDLIGGTAPSYRVATTGTAPNRVTTIQWKNVTDKLVYETPQYVNFQFQIKLYETTNVIELVYGLPTAGTGTAAFRFSAVGLKGVGAPATGPANNTYVFGVKQSAALWSAATFTSAATAYPTVNFRQTVLPDAGRTFRFTPGTGGGGGATAPANDNCTAAVALTSAATCVTTTGTLAGATQSLAPIACAGSTSSSANDVWYQFTATATSHTITANSAFDCVLELLSGTCTTLANVDCADRFFAGSEVIAATGLTVGTTYYVRFYPFDGVVPAAPTFTICVTNGSAAPCGDPTMATIGNATATSLQINFTPGAGNVSYNVTYTPAGGTATTVTPNPTASPIIISGLTANTTYTVSIQSVCAGGATGAVLTGTARTLSGLPAPANDNPTGAVALPVAATCTPTNSTNAGATTTAPNGYTNPSTPTPTCGIAINPSDVWFTFVATGTAATITVTGAPAGLLRAFTAATSAGAFTQVSCTASAANNTVSPPLALTGLTAGRTYYVSVSGRSSADTQGAFTICVTAPAAPTCNAVTGLSAASANNGTNAIVSFTPSATATSYTVTRQQLPGGAIVPQTATASPVTITGLTANTTYLISVTSNCPNGQASAASTTPLRTTLAAREALGNGALAVYPNPAQGSFVLTLPALAGERTAAVTLLNALGQTVYSRALALNAAGTETRVDVSSLAKGVYTLRVKTSNQTATKAVTVE